MPFIQHLDGACPSHQAHMLDHPAFASAGPRPPPGGPRCAPSRGDAPPLPRPDTHSAPRPLLLPLPWAPSSLAPVKWLQD